MEKQILIYETETGKKPFEDFLKSLDITEQSRVYSRINRMEYGHYGDYKNVGNGIFELRFTFSGGIRIYFAEIDRKIILLLCGGNKNTQKRDIQKAKEYWSSYNE
jgi:putative addiction module killer protein